MAMTAGDRVAVSVSPRARTTEGGLLSGPPETIFGTVAAVSVKGNVYVHLDGGAGQPSRFSPEKVALLYCEHCGCNIAYRCVCAKDCPSHTNESSLIGKRKS